MKHAIAITSGTAMPPLACSPLTASYSNARHHDGGEMSETAETGIRQPRMLRHKDNH